MTISIKIECACGQRYAFDVEPVNDRMASAVACPMCGADGSIAANTIIAQSMPQPASLPKPVLGLQVATQAVGFQTNLSGPDPPPAALLPGQLEPAKAQAEARSKIFWGDSPEDVVKFLMTHSFNHHDATASVRAMAQERKITLRGIGIWKIVSGIGMMAVPVVVYMIMAHFHFVFFKLLAIAIMVGLWGAWSLFKGLIMVFVPKLETGDVADQ